MSDLTTERPRFCRHCGSPLDPDARFCGDCGAAVASGQEPSGGVPPRPEGPATGAPREALRQGPRSRDTPQQHGSAPPEHRRRRGAWVGGAVAVVLLLGVGGAIALVSGGGGKKTRGSAANPLNALAVGGNSACAIEGDGRVACWGDNSYGELGIGTTSGPETCPGPLAEKVPCSTRPIVVRGLGDIVAVTNGGWVNCALRRDQTVWCWGNNSSGTLGAGATVGPESCSHTDVGEARPCSSVPVQVKGIRDATAIASHSSTTCALLADRTVECWGDNREGDLGIGAFAGPETCHLGPCSTTPRRVRGISGATAVAAGCAVLSSGAIECWGGNGAGDLGSGDTSGPEDCAQPGDEDPSPCSTTPVRVRGISNAVAVTSGNHGCALLKGGTIDCWGYAAGGQLGNGTDTGPETCSSNQECSTVPVQVVGITDARAVATPSSGFSCALRLGGRVSCWGNNVNGQLGDGATSDRSTPQDVPGVAGATAIGTGDGAVCARLPSGVKCWGDNSAGQLGDGTTVGRMHPVGVMSASTSSGAPDAPAHSRLSISSSCADWYAARTKERQHFAATIEPTVPLKPPLPTDAKEAEAFMYGFVFGQCDRAKKAGVDPADATMSRVLAAEFSP